MKYGIKSHNSGVMIFIPITKKTRSVMLLIDLDGVLRYNTGHLQERVDYDGGRRVKVIGVDMYE